MVSVERIEDYLTNVEMEDDRGEAEVAFDFAGRIQFDQALLRMIPIESGKITLDGVSISSIPLPVLRRAFGVVPQHPFIFSGSLYENLIVGCEHVDQSQVANIARVAHLDTLMTRIGGLDGQIDEGGKNLSFGERQIISICRVLLAKCKLYQSPFELIPLRR
ncbi:hypothetical protein OSTOST_19107 [Ostertagia ostertagi]